MYNNFDQDDNNVDNAIRFNTLGNEKKYSVSTYDSRKEQNFDTYNYYNNSFSKRKYF